MRSNIPKFESLASPPLLSKPLPGEALFLYVAVSNIVVSATLIREGGGIQRPVYYVSKALIDAQTRYTRIEKLVLALFVTVRKLTHYFQSFPVVVLIEYPLRSIVENSEASDRTAKWVTKIRPLGVTFEPRPRSRDIFWLSSSLNLLQDHHHRAIPWKDES